MTNVGDLGALLRLREFRRGDVFGKRLGRRLANALVQQFDKIAVVFKNYVELVPDDKSVAEKNVGRPYLNDVQATIHRLGEPVAFLVIVLLIFRARLGAF